jgi:hypothetical protein
VDEDAAVYGERPNKAARGLIRLYRPAPLPCLGVVLTGTPDAGGSPAGLGHARAVVLVGLYLDAATVGLVPHARS